MSRQVELICTGSELLNGSTLNRHPQELALRLVPLGAELARSTTVPDSTAEIGAAVREAMSRVDLVLISGGLGPTSDDLTRDAVAHVLGRRVVMDDATRTDIRGRYAQMKRKLTPAGERQAMVVEGAIVLRNRLGAAPGELLESEGKYLVLLPGPPAEFLVVLEDHVLPWLQGRLGPPERAREKVFLAAGLGESDIVDRFHSARFPPPGVQVAYCAILGRVEIRLSAPGATERLESASERIKALLGHHIYAEERVGMEEVVGGLLAEQRATVAVAESCTGGLLGHLLTSVSGSSAYFLGGIIAYADRIKVEQLGVSSDALERQGAVSEAVAREMAVGCRDRFGSDYALSVTGIAGPTGGTAEKPVGLVYVALATAEQTWVRRRRFPHDRYWVKEGSCISAMDMLRRRLTGAL